MKRKTWIKILIVIGLVGMIPQLSYAKGISIRANVSQAFNFHKEEQTPIGHITSLSIAGEKFKNSLTVQNPTKIESGPDEKVVGVISNIRWNGGQSDPIIFTCQVTAENREKAAILTHTKLSNTEVELAFNLYEFDIDSAQVGYYRSFYTSEQGIKGEIEKNSGMLEFEIDMDPSPEVPSPRNYELYLSVMPSDTNAYLLELALSKSSSFKKPWGFNEK
jgi:hypothetical protein